MIYNVTYLGHRVTLLWLDLRSSCDLDLSRSNYTWFDAPWRDKHDGIKIVALPLQLKILSSKNRFGKFWNFDPWWPQFWPEPKNDRSDFEMIFRELSNAVFRFVLRCAGAEIDGGGVQTPPPPSRWWKIQRPSRARVKLWIVQHATITRDASPRREFDGINWDLGSGIVEKARVVRGNVHTRILQGWGGDRVGGGGGKRGRYYEF